jgi:hypothetical protein
MKVFSEKVEAGLIASIGAILFLLMMAGLALKG